jgi:tRNA U55 pseudouridine synthase TruB
MSALRRLAIGPFNAAQGIAIDQLDGPTIGASLLPPLLALGELPQIVLNHEEIARARQGRIISATYDPTAAEIAAVDSGGHLVAILKPAGDRKLTPLKCFAVSAER